MRKLTAPEIKEIEFNILSEVASFCDKNDIHYFLAAGTALGAVRHKGFIPWDDDIDICIPRPDYERFVQGFNLADYRLLEKRFDRNYPYAFAKVCDPRTTLIENIEKPFPMGVYIDVFPIDGLPDEKKERKKHIRRIYWDIRILSWKRISKEKKVGFPHKIIQIFANILLMPVSISFLVDRLDKDVRKYSFDDSNIVGYLVGKSIWGSDEKPKEVFTKRIRHKFEDADFWISEKYDTYLKLEYGDYMKLPPKEKQKSVHDFVAYWNE